MSAPEDKDLVSFYVGYLSALYTRLHDPILSSHTTEDYKDLLRSEYLEHNKLLMTLDPEKGEQALMDVLYRTPAEILRRPDLADIPTDSELKRYEMAYGESLLEDKHTFTSENGVLYQKAYDKWRSRQTNTKSCIGSEYSTHDYIHDIHFVDVISETFRKSADGQDSDEFHGVLMNSYANTMHQIACIDPFRAQYRAGKIVTESQHYDYALVATTACLIKQWSEQKPLVHPHLEDYAQQQQLPFRNMYRP